MKTLVKFLICYLILAVPTGIIRFMFPISWTSFIIVAGIYFFIGYAKGIWDTLDRVGGSNFES